MKNLLISAMLVGMLGACASQDVKEEPKAPIEDRTAATQSDSGSSQTQPADQDKLDSRALGTNVLKDPNSPLSKRIVYYEYDSAAIKDEYRPLIRAHAKYLADQRSARMTVQGHTDERGSREYNLALGQRRAEGVKKAMSVLGASDNQIDTVSYGEEQPAVTGSDESSWAKNRRAAIIYQGE